MAKKKVIGLVEKVAVIGSGGKVVKRALLDTGATRSSVDLMVAAKAGIGPIVGTVRIKSKRNVKGYIRRTVAWATIKIKGKKIKLKVNIEDRENMPYKVLIGRDIIQPHFLIDVSKTHTTHKIEDVRK